MTLQFTLCIRTLPIGKYVAPRSLHPRSLAQICRCGIYLIFYRQDITGMSFSARNSLTKRKWRPNEDHVEAIERPVNGSTSASSSVAPPSSGYLPRWNHSFVFLHDRPAEEDARKTEKKDDRTIDSLLSFSDRERRETESNKYIYIYIWEEKREGPVIGICAVLKSRGKSIIDRAKEWKIISIGVVCHRRCGLWQTLRLPSPSQSRLLNTVIGEANRDWSFDFECDFDCSNTGASAFHFVITKPRWQIIARVMRTKRKQNCFVTNQVTVTFTVNFFFLYYALYL